MHLIGFIIRIYHDARSSECQNYTYFSHAQANVHVAHNRTEFRALQSRTSKQYAVTADRYNITIFPASQIAMIWYEN